MRSDWGIKWCIIVAINIYKAHKQPSPFFSPSHLTRQTLMAAT